jgi:hypothetical protein
MNQGLNFYWLLNQFRRYKLRYTDVNKEDFSSFEDGDMLKITFTERNVIIQLNNNNRIGASNTGLLRILFNEV